MFGIFDPFFCCLLNETSNFLDSSFKTDDLFRVFSRLNGKISEKAQSHPSELSHWSHFSVWIQENHGIFNFKVC